MSKKESLQESCRKISGRVLKEIESMAFNSKRQMVKLTACKEILDRGYGKPKEQIDIAGDIVINLRRKDIKNV